MVVVPAPDLERHRKVHFGFVDPFPRSEQVGDFFLPHLVDLHRAVVVAVPPVVAGDDVETAGFLPHLLEHVHKLLLRPSDLEREGRPFLAWCVDRELEDGKVGLEGVVRRRGWGQSCGRCG